MNNAAIYAGTFDPLTYGHLDVIERGARIFDKLVVAVADGSAKNTLFSRDERIAMIRDSLEASSPIEVEGFNGLLVDYARRRDIHVILRGLRAVADFEFEFQMALTNRKMAPDIETLFLMPAEEFSYVSSSTIKEIAALGATIDTFVPPPVCEALYARYPGTS